MPTGFSPQTGNARQSDAIDDVADDPGDATANAVAINAILAVLRKAGLVRSAP